MSPGEEPRRLSSGQPTDPISYQHPELGDRPQKSFAPLQGTHMASIGHWAPTPRSGLAIDQAHKSFCQIKQQVLYFASSMIQQKGTTSSSFSIIPQDTFNFPNQGRETYLMLSWQNKSILHLLNYHSLHYPRGILLYFANLYSIAKNVFNFKPWTICSTLLYFTYYNSLDQSFPYHLEQPVFLYPSHIYS